MSTLGELRQGIRRARRAPGHAALLALLLALGAGVVLGPLALALRGIGEARRLETVVGLEVPVRHVPVVSASGELASTIAPPRAELLWGGGGSALLTRVPLEIGELQEAALAALLWTLVGAVALALAVACSNLALLLLSRAAARRQEIAMRGALGCTGRRMALHLLGEVGLPAAAGTALALALGALATAALRATWPAGLLPWTGRPAAGWAALAAVGLPLATVLLFAVSPARLLRRRDLHPLVAGGTRATAGPGEGALRARLSVAAVAVSVVLLVGAGLLLRSFGSAQTARDPGIDPSDTLTLTVRPPAAYAADPAQRAAYYEAVLERARGVPGVRAASLSSPGAWLGVGTTDLAQVMTGITVRPGILRPARYHAVSPGYFRAHGIPVRQGREFAPGDRAGAPAVAVVSQTFAYRFFPRVPAVGKPLQPGRMSLNGTWYTVVGVVADVRPPGIGNAAQPEPAVYLSALQVPPAEAGLAVRAADPLGREAPLRRALAALPRPPALAEAMTLEERLARFREPLRWFGGIFAALAALSALLAGLGVYGVISRNVARRTREIGIRAALGARPRQVIALVMRDGVRLAALGLLFGAMGAVCLARLLHYLFHGVRLLDPLVYGGVAALLGGVALLATFLPARHAAGVEPTIALREE